jgi:hypothetical protein
VNHLGLQPDSRTPPHRPGRAGPGPHQPPAPPRRAEVLLGAGILGVVGILGLSTPARHDAIACRSPSGSRGK